MSQPNPWMVIQSIAEQRIAEAQEQGAFDNLPGAGRPLQLEDDSHIPPELRMAYKVLRNAGCLPPEMQERKDIANLADMLEQCEDEQERGESYDDYDEQYYDRLLDRLSRKMSAGRAGGEEA